MFEELNERRKAVERNIAKGFGIDDADLDLEKALEDEFEKGRAKKQFNIGDTFTRHGITYKCTGISANTGRPTWSKVKDGGGNTKENKSNEELDTSQKQERAKILEFYKKYEDFRNEIETNLGEVNVNEIPFKTLKREFENWYEDAQYVIKKQHDQSDKKDERQKPKKLSELKRGDTVALIMERYNPQLGDYVTIKKVQIEGTTSKSFEVDYMKFNKETGERSDKSSSVYGSSKHYILLPEEVNTHIKDGKWKGDRISGENPFEDEQ